MRSSCHHITSCHHIIMTSYHSYHIQFIMSSGRDSMSSHRTITISALYHHVIISHLRAIWYIRYRGARHRWSVRKAFAVLLCWIGILSGDIRASACPLLHDLAMHDLAASGRHQNSEAFTELEPLRLANGALLGGSRAKPSGRQGCRGHPKSIQMDPQREPLGASRVPK